MTEKFTSWNPTHSTASILQATTDGTYTHVQTWDQQACKNID